MAVMFLKRRTKQGEASPKRPNPAKKASPTNKKSNEPKRRPRSSIRWKLLTTMIGLTVGMIVTLTAIELVLQKKALEAEQAKRIELMKANLLERGSTLSNLLLTQVENDVAAFNFSHIGEVLNRTIQESPLLSYGILMNTEGVVFIHTQFPERQQEILQDEAARYALAQQRLTHREYDDINVTEFVLPIHFGATQWGVLRLGFSMAEFDKEMERSRADIAVTIHDLLVTTAAIAAVFVLFGTVIVMFISTTLSRPLIRLTEAVKELARGHYELATQMLNPQDSPGSKGFKAEGEIGMLAASFLEMADEIHNSHQRLEEYNRNLEEKVRERTQELEQANDKLKELDQMKTNFLSTVSHELRTPLTSVMGFARILQKKFETTLFPPLSQSEDKKIQKAMRQVMDNAQIIVEEGERLTTLINDVLDLAKMEAGRVDWNMQPLQVGDIIDRAMAATSALVANKPVRMLKEIEANLPLFEGDRDRLIQVVINLISNAVKFTNEGDVICKAVLGENELIVSVKDSGCGIKKEDQPLVFEKFKQVGDTLTDKPKGTGLGLPICKEIVEHHGGQLWLESEVGEGSTFLFSLPLVQAEAGTMLTLEGYTVSWVWHSDYASVEQQLDRYLAQQQRMSASRNILIIDDDVNIRQFLAQELSGEGYKIREANSGEQGLATISEQQPDLIVLDVRMPHLNGFEVTALLHTNPVTLHIPIVLHTVAEDKKLGEQLGIDRYLTKPVEGTVLLATVHELLDEACSPKRILLWDDQPERLQHWAKLVANCGYDVETASNVKMAMLIAEAFVPHLVIAPTRLAEQEQVIRHLREEKGLDQMFFALLD